MSESKETFLVISAAILCIFVLCLFAAGVQVYVSVNFMEANMIRIEVDANDVYIGKEAYAKIISGGNTTTVTTYKRLWPVPIKERTYSGTCIKVFPVGQDE